MLIFRFYNLISRIAMEREDVYKRQGVETRGEARTVRSLGVGFGQGYWYGRPMALEAIIAAPNAQLVPAGR